MPSKPFPPNTLKQANDIALAWKAINPAFKVGEMTFADFENAIAQADASRNRISSLKAQLIDEYNRSDALRADLWDKVKRARAGVKGAYGDDSSQYEMVGGTRRSERKPRTRKPKPAASTPQ
ncbi:MAG: hypothetical protein WA821_23075 [Anaerolineales bacterium]